MVLSCYEERKFGSNKDGYGSEKRKTKEEVVEDC